MNTQPNMNFSTQLKIESTFDVVINESGNLIEVTVGVINPYDPTKNMIILDLHSPMDPDLEDGLVISKYNLWPRIQEKAKEIYAEEIEYRRRKIEENYRSSEKDL